MPWTVLALIAGKAKSALSWLLGVVSRHPWPLACIALLLASWSLWNGKTEALAQRDAARSTLRAEKAGRKADQANWRRQVADAVAAKKAAERKSQEIATDAQKTRDALVADNVGLRSYIDRNRLRTKTGAATAARATDDLGAAIPDAAATGTIVAVSEADLVTCDALYAYARPAYEWAQGLIGKGLAAPPDH